MKIYFIKITKQTITELVQKKLRRLAEINQELDSHTLPNEIETERIQEKKEIIEELKI